MGAVSASLRAEMVRLGRWPAVWVLVAVWTLLQVMFSFVFPYLAFTSGDAGAFQGGPADQVLASMLPAAVPVNLVQGTPMFGGAIAMILGALAVAGGYSWSTWKTVLTQGPRRLPAMAGTLVAVAVVLAGLLLLTLVVDLGLSNGIALLEGQPVGLPGAVDVLQALGAAGLVLGMWAAAGAVLGALTRNPALAVGLGLVWTLVVENLLRGAAGLLDWLAVLTDRMPGTAAGSLVGALGAAADGPDATPGVLTTLGGGAAVLVLIGYLVVFLAGTLGLIGRRDLA